MGFIFKLEVFAILEYSDFFHRIIYYTIEFHIRYNIWQVNIILYGLNIILNCQWQNLSLNNELLSSNDTLCPIKY